MNLFKRAKIFALFILIFASFYTAAAQDDSIYRLGTDTLISVKMDIGVSSAVNAKDDTFTVRVAKPLERRGVVVVPIGTMIEGRITEIRRAGTGRRSGRLVAVFESIRFADGIWRPLNAELELPVRPDRGHRLDAFGVAAGGIAGMALGGGVSRSMRGGLIGAAIGIGTGTGFALLRKGREAEIGEGEEFGVVLKAPFLVPFEEN